MQSTHFPSYPHNLPQSYFFSSKIGSHISFACYDSLILCNLELCHPTQKALAMWLPSAPKWLGQTNCTEDSAHTQNNVEVIIH